MIKMLRCNRLVKNIGGVIIVLMIFTKNQSYSQAFDDTTYNIIITALPFLEHSSNARIESFGSIASVSSDFYTDTGLFQNPALLSTKGQYAGGNISYKNYFDDVYFNDKNLFWAIDSVNTIGYNRKYFDYGTVSLADEYGELLSITNPYEFSHQVTYSRLIKKHFALGIGLKYIKSDFDIGEHEVYKVVKTYAIDFGCTFDKKYKLSKKSVLNLNFGSSINNFGPKISYIKEETEETKKFIPTKLHLGVLINPDFHLSDKMRLNIDFAYQIDKYLVPTPPIYDENHDIVDGMDPNISPFRALYQSFYDAPYGFKEEMNELGHRFGGEVRFSIEDYFYAALRTGKILTYKTKGSINKNSLGIGVGAFGFSLDFGHVNHALYANSQSAIALGFRTDVNKLFRF